MSEFWDDSMIRDLASFLQLKINKKPEQDNRKFYLITNKRGIEDFESEPIFRTI